ncbi:regulator of G-protein signaling 1 isoform X2 [Clupea harengus]|uniref:Regulator of G-protein signaling 1 isoform X2 n=1 Tax=Clupea harengus TaxID=7950 RepID=A0A6P8GTS1_CLUHA|nr:regulator of G-protein signaling 1 isoform X2 [Clupea harengus]
MSSSMASSVMRRFSSEGSLLDLDVLPWRRVALKTAEEAQEGLGVGIYTPDHSPPRSPVPVMTTPRGGRGGAGRELVKEHSMSVENIHVLDKAPNDLQLLSLNESYRAYSDGQLAPAPAGSRESIGRDAPPSPSGSKCNPLSNTSLHRNQARARLSAAKLHIKSLFSTSPHSSHSNLAATEQKNSATSTTERRSRLPFLKQWSQVGHSRARLCREEMESWALSLSNLLSSRTGLSVFGAFLRSEFSEENLQFYLSCEQYRHSSNNFSLQRRARDICATFIQPGAPREVNLDSKTRELTLQLLQAPSHTSLSQAQKRIYSLLDTDCYPRFLQSQIYTSLLQDAD